MMIQVSGKGFELDPELRDEVEERIGTALNRFETRIGRVNIFLADVNGPKNGIDKSVRVIVDIERLPLIVVEDKGNAWHSILDRTVERAVFAVSRQIDRTRSRTDRTSMAGDADDTTVNEPDEANWNALWQLSKQNH